MRRQFVCFFLTLFVPVPMTTVSIGVDILVASPGRMLDHLKETPGFAKRCAAVKVRDCSFDNTIDTRNSFFDTTL